VQNDQNEFLFLLAAALVAVFLFLWTQRRRPKAAQSVEESWVLVDGSNVMHWQDQTPSLDPVKAVVVQLAAQGYVPGIVFDANAGWKLMGRYLHDGDFARLLGIHSRQVRVVPKGTQADPFLLQTSREFGARIVTNDRYRDWAADHPEVLEPGFLIQGRMLDGQVWLKGLDPSKGAL
jgi:hypothetical protein